MVTSRTRTIIDDVAVAGDGLERIGRFAVAGPPDAVAAWLREAADAAARLWFERIEVEMLFDGRLHFRGTRKEERE